MHTYCRRASERANARNELSEPRRSGPMDCSTSFEVVAEISLSPSGSMCSLSSNHSAAEEGQPIDIVQNTTDGQQRTSSAALLVSASRLQLG